MGKQARLRSLRSTIKTMAADRKVTPVELSNHLFANKQKRSSRRNDESLQAAWYFIRTSSR